MSEPGNHRRIVFCLLMVVFTVLSKGQQVDLNGPSLNEREYYCVEEELVFTCVGLGTSIRWTVPPLFINQGFINFDTPPLNMSIGGSTDATICLQRVTPTFMSTLKIRNVPNITVQCSTNVQGSLNMRSLTSSTIPSQVPDVLLEIQADLRMVNISWTPVTGTFDFKHYRVQLCVNRMCMDFRNTTVVGISDNISDDFSLANEDTIQALVSVVSQCGDIGIPGSSIEAKLFQLLPSTNQDIAAVIALSVVCSILVPFPLISLLLLLKWRSVIKSSSVANNIKVELS